MKPPAICLSNVFLSLQSSSGKVQILNDINLQIEEEEAVALVGPSGSGKSSLMMLISGLEHSTKGNINILGQNITQFNEDKLATFRSKNMGVVFQSFHLIPTMSAIENVATPLNIMGEKNADEKALSALNDVGLIGRKSHYPSQLSGGEQQRIALARAIVTKPRILLADEPTGNLDITSGNRVVEILFNFRKRFQATLLIVTHASELAKKCDRQINLKDGKIE